MSFWLAVTLLELPSRVSYRSGQVLRGSAIARRGAGDIRAVSACRWLDRLGNVTIMDTVPA